MQGWIIHVIQRNCNICINHNTTDLPYRAAQPVFYKPINVKHDSTATAFHKKKKKYFKKAFTTHFLSLKVILE